MKILFIGLGSIGQRHIQNLNLLYGNDIKFYAVRATSHNNFIKEGLSKKINDLNDYYKIEVFKSIDDAMQKYKYDAVFVTNPSSLHAKTIIKCLEFGVNIFVEKPLCVTTEEGEIIKSKLKKTDSILYIGYQNHFDPLFQKVKDVIYSKKLGDLVSARFEWCTYLPDHHKYEDYKKSYAARSDLGGGVLLGLSHEIDMIISLFGPPNSLTALKSNNKNINLTVDDTIMALCDYSNNNNNFILNLTLSYSQILETRNFKVHLEEGFIDCDINKRKITILDNNNSKLPEIFESNISRNEIFIAQTKKFINAILSNDKSIINIDNSINILNFIKSIKSQVSY